MTVTMHRASESDSRDIWAKIAAPLPPSAIAWRQDGRVIQRDGRFLARFVCYVEAGTVRERLDSVVPGEWNLTLEPLPVVTTADPDGEDNSGIAFKARLQILGVVREDVGQGRDYKAASTDAFKRVAVRFGIGHELYEMGLNWVEMDGDGKYAKPTEDPQVAYERRQARSGATAGNSGAAPAAAVAAAMDIPACPKCGGRMWDNRLGKRNPLAPDFKCRDKSCDGVIWPPKPGEGPKGNGGSAGPTPGGSAPAQTTTSSNGTTSGTTNPVLPIPDMPHTGVALREIPTDALERYAERCRDVIARRQADGKDDAKIVELLEQIGEVLADRAAQATASAPAPAAPAAQTKGKKGEKQPISLGDDDLPF